MILNGKFRNEDAPWLLNKTLSTSIGCVRSHGRPNLDAIDLSYRFAMSRRVAGFSALGLAVLFAIVLGVATGLGTVNTYAQRIAFGIATGPSGGTYYPMGRTLAGLISHPPGVDRCAAVYACGPEGLIASAQTSPGAFANVLAVNSGDVESALAQSDVVADGVAGRGLFKAKQSHVRTLAVLYPEDVHIVAGINSRINSIADLKGKRVSLGAENSGTMVTARAVLNAFRIPASRLKASNDDADVAAQKLASGKLDAFFFVGGAPVPLVQSLIVSGRAKLIPIGGDGRERLIAQSHGMSADVISPSIYGTHSATQTVKVNAVWIVNDSVSASTVYALAKTLFNPANRMTLDRGPPSAQEISLRNAADNAPAPIHLGALSFYKEARALPKI